VVTPVRGAGRTYGVFVMERLMDLAARQLGMDPTEIREKNFVQPDQFPYPTGVVGQDFVENVLDSGNYPETMRKTKEMIGYDHLVKEELPRLRALGKHVGIGLVCFVEGTAVGPYEGGRVSVDAGGKVLVATGISSQGQGHFTSFAQVAAEQLGVKMENVRVITGDTGIFHWGAGTFASRGATVAGTAIHKAAVAVREKSIALAAQLFEVEKEQIELTDGKAQVKGDPKQSISLGDLAMRSNPTRGTFPPGVEPGLEATAYYGPPYGATGQGCVAMVVEVDPDTFETKITRFVLVHDCGIVINPMIVEGQVHGGVSMGIGNSYYEQLVYDENGQLLNASLMDYLIPMATDMPPKMELGHVETPSPLNPLGMKGVGEAGAIPIPAAFVQALETAFPEYDLEIIQVPLTPSKLFHIIEEAKKK
jgi:CO/xanthine dehydrogenase Mo-binding subunit